MLGIQIGEGGNSFIRNQDFDSEMYNFISFSKSQLSYCIKNTADFNPAFQTERKGLSFLMQIVISTGCGR